MDVSASRKARWEIVREIHGRVSCSVQVAVGGGIAIGFDLVHRYLHSESLVRGDVGDGSWKLGKCCLLST